MPSDCRTKTLVIKKVLKMMLRSVRKKSYRRLRSRLVQSRSQRRKMLKMAPKQMLSSLTQMKIRRNLWRRKSHSLALKSRKKLFR